MKKINYLLSVALIAGFLASCGDDDKKQEDPTPKATQPAKIDGAWNLVSFSAKSYYANGTIRDSSFYTYQKGFYVETYTAPSGITVTTNGNTVSGLYAIKQDSLFKPFMKNAGSGNYKLKIDSLTATRLVMNTTLKNAVNGKSVWLFKYSR